MTLPVPASPDFGPPQLPQFHIVDAIATDAPQQSDALAPSTTEKRRSAREWLRAKCIGAYFVEQAFYEDLDNGYAQANSFAEKADITATTALALSGQVYERARGPEIVGTWLLVKTYTEAIKRGEAPYIPYAAAVAAGLALGAAVYAQQKIIGKNWLRASDTFPITYETVNQEWPKIVKAVEEVKPDPEHRVSEGYAMFQFGVTPFIASAIASNPDIPMNERVAIEKRVTRRGAAFSAALGTAVLSVRSAALDIPGHAAELVNEGVDTFLDWVTNPWICAALFSIVPAAKQIKAAIENRQVKTAE